ncbi:MAG: AAA family ATPase [Oscillospiraceae bacterium]|nr:AAA family ATPase [Oscillospiraceae bacterium]
MDLNIRLFLPILAKLSEADPGYYTTEARLNIAVGPFPGIPDNKAFILDMNSEYILILNKDEKLSADLKTKDYSMHINDDGVTGYTRMVEHAEAFVKHVYTNLVNFKKDKNVSLMLANYEKDPEFNKNYEQIFSDWISRNISDMFANTSAAPTDGAVAGDGSTLGKLEDFLSNMIGLDEIKDVLRRFVAILEFAEKTKDDFNIEVPNLHMVFKGSAGTGKTMLANILAELYTELGMIETGGKPVKITVVNGTSLLVYDAPKKVRELCEQANGGVLLIDEAYAISESRSGVGDEVIATMLTEMEARKASLAMIFAGYTLKMDKFLSMNPGLRSRIGANITLADYTPAEMLEMIKRMFDKSGFKVTLDAMDAMEAVFKEAVRYKDFGNGRFVARFYQDIVSEHAFKVRGVKDKEELRTIKARDITRNVVVQVLRGASVN